MRTREEIGRIVSGSSARGDLRSLTVKELRIAVREAVKDVNTRYQYMESEQARIAYDKLKIYGMNKPKEEGLNEAIKREKTKVVAGNVNWKSKEELLDQLQALRKFQRFDYESPEALKSYEQEWEDAAKRFRSRYPQYADMSTEDLKLILNTLDKYSDLIDSSSWKYELIELAKTANTQGKKLDMNQVLDVIKNADGMEKGEVLDEIYKTAGIERHSKK